MAGRTAGGPSGRVSPGKRSQVQKRYGSQASTSQDGAAVDGGEAAASEMQEGEQLQELNAAGAALGEGAAHRNVVARMESAFGVSFLGVTLRTDAGAAERAAGLGARAYTDGREIGFAEGVFDPNSREGLHTIAHEFAHVAQARGGTAGALGEGSAGLSSQGVRGKQDDDRAEDEIEAGADAAADAVVAGNQPNVADVELGSTATDKGKHKKPIKTPAAGSYHVGITGLGDLYYSFNGEEVRRRWSGDGIANAVAYYLRDAFPGASMDVIEACRAAVGLYWTDGFNPKKSVGPVVTAHVPKAVHDGHQMVRGEPPRDCATPCLLGLQGQRQGDRGQRP